ncbi:MAG: phosphoribosylformylglycinamidine synthase [Nevskiaceae bacterium]|nr:MAG: phosphoribosylformylglycinamidine synthase [Nevskiaceae bacterium]TBR71656.1 MAG: phosphoribosylformylglycinamidine synthase [Nevskiaceae bacterium]
MPTLSRIRVLPDLVEVADFRHQRLVETLRTLIPDLSGLRQFPLYLADADATVADDRLRALLGIEARPLPPADLTVYVVPRLGVTSPWSSKATDIARVCGLPGVARLEHARVLLIDGVAELPAAAHELLHDRMTETLLFDAAQLTDVFATQPPRALRTVRLGDDGAAALARANTEWGLSLSAEEIRYLVDYYQQAGRDPTDAELVMFAQINSEHCRHKIFNAAFTLDGRAQPLTLFQLIKQSHAATPEGVLSAYKDNAAVVEGPTVARWFADADRTWRQHVEPQHLLMKVETHNHPTGISPHPGAATGSGGEIRDEGATGRGGKPRAALCGFAVSNLRIPGFAQPWETGDGGRPAHMASALQIMLEAPIGAASYNNEFGRPALNGYFRTFAATLSDGTARGYHKPVMIAGGYGAIRDGHVQKQEVPAGARLIVLGGPAMLIGLGGGAASSRATASDAAELDFASVQRANPELERRCQEVIDACWALGAANPILSIHDVGAGGLSNALPEIIDTDGRGGTIHLRDIQCADPALSPMEIWCNEAQERYVLAITAEHVAELEAICARERCPFAVVGTATAEARLQVTDGAAPTPVDVPMPVLLGHMPQMQRTAQHGKRELPALKTREIKLDDALARVLRLPAVAAKTFLVTIGDRTVGGLTVRDQMVGPWQVPVADCAVTASGFEAATGEAMAMGERPLIALTHAAASARMAVGEAVTNLAAARIVKLSDVRLSANWMAACGSDDEDARLYDAVRAVGAELCPALGLAIPVGKDSLSMRTVWKHGDETRTQTSPLTLNVSAFAPVADVRGTLTPQLRTDAGATRLLLVELSKHQRLGGSALGQVYNLFGGAAPDVDEPALLAKAFATLQKLAGAGRVLAYHDRSDGGLIVTLAEMAFAGHCGLDVAVDTLGPDAVAALFNEELGMVLQVRESDAAPVCSAFARDGLRVTDIGAPNGSDTLRFTANDHLLLEKSRVELHRMWAETSYRLQALRDDPDCAREAFDAVGDPADPGLSVHLTFNPDEPAAPAIATHAPRIAILREQGVNGQAEMAWAFHVAGFEAVDVHMSDLIAGRITLDGFTGFAACGGFSYGDVLGAGVGWANSILWNAPLRARFESFLARPDRFALGVCNGCQMLSALKPIIPGAAHWPAFRRNRSQQFEARWTQVEVSDTRSLFFAGMAGSQLPIAVSHGEGRAEFTAVADRAALAKAGQVALRFIDHHGAIATRYPDNPNGSPDGIGGLCNADGRVTILMPHPERTVAGTVGSWWPQRHERYTPWVRLFRNARRWVG